MRILSGAHVRKAIKRCAPTHIAVAYLGADFRDFIGVGNLKEIIISPTLGTNPHAVVDLSKAKGWQSIHLLDTLHAKVYLGKKAAVVGSANLTKNGLSGQALQEAAVWVDGEEELRALRDLFEQLKKKAKNQYTSTDLKKACISALKAKWSEAFSSGLISTPRAGKVRNKNPMSFSEYELLANNDFYVVYYGWQPSEKKLGIENEIRSEIADFIGVFRGDATENGKFVLKWNLEKPSECEWMFIHDQYLLPEDSDAKPYTRLLIQRKRQVRPAPPFVIDQRFKNAFWASCVHP